MNIPGQICRGTKFGEAIFNICSKPFYNIFIESGTWNGLGTTKLLVDATEKNALASIYSIEANKQMHSIALQNWANKPARLQLLYGRLAETMMSKQAILSHPLFPAIRGHYDLHYDQDVRDFATAPLIFDLPRYCDVAVLDGGEFSSEGDLDRLLGLKPKVIILDDTNIVKNSGNLRRLLCSGEWAVAARGNEKTGWAILTRAGSADDVMNRYTEKNLVPQNKSLSEYLKGRGFTEFEGHSQQVPKQVEDLIKLTSKPNARVMEIGFNAGHSAEVFLKNNPTLSLLSFDLGDHDYVIPAKQYIDVTYPGRHSLHLGDSLETVPKYIAKNPGATFDVIFIDGGHDYSIAAGDLENCRALANENTVVVVDDTIYTAGWAGNWNVGPTRAWLECLKGRSIEQVGSADYTPGRGMSWGRYVPGLKQNQHIK